MADIFLSYAEEDRAAARRIVGVLEAQGWSVWWDRRIPTGKTWRSAIEDGIRDMGCMVVLWSSNSIGSEWVNEEAEEGRAAAKLMPVLIERVRPPLGLRGLQATDLIDWDGSNDAAAIRQLISDITAMMPAPVPAPDPAAPLSKHTVVHREDKSPLPAAKKTLFRPVWAGALVLAAVAALTLVWREQPASPVATKPTPPAAAVVIPTPVPAPAAPAAALAPVPAPAPAPAGPAPVTHGPGPAKTVPADAGPARPVVAPKREQPLAAIAKRGGKSKVDQSRCEAIVQRAQLGTPMGEEDKAFLKRDCQP